MKQKHVFGGSWTDKKLTILGTYLTEYSTALKNQRFDKEYIDAFAGSGTRENSAEAKAGELRRRDAESGYEQTSLLDEDVPVRQFLDGSARIALNSSPGFERYIFIEKNAARWCELDELKAGFPHLSEQISVLNGDANSEIERLCQRDWSHRRAVLFLDPYGMEVRWTTIETIARTKAIDLWVLFPLSGVNRMLTRSGEIPDTWQLRLDELLGTREWRDTLYHSEAVPSLFGDRIEHHVKAGTDVISRFFLQRLDSCFAGVAPNPKVLRNSKNSPLFLLCFAAANPAGAPVALRIASHILNM